MATPPTRVSYNTPSTGNFSSTATSRTTTSFNVTAGDIIVVLCSIENAGSQTVVTPSASGGSVTWTQQVRVPAASNANVSGAWCWTGVVGSTAAGITVSLNRPSSDTSLWWGMSATVYSAHGGVGVVFNGNNGTGSGAPSVAATCSANSAVVCQVNDWNAVSGGSRVWRTINGAAQTETVYFTSAVHHTVYGGYAPDTGAAGSITQGLTAPATQRWVLAGVEILGTTGGGGSTLDVASTGTGTSTGSLAVSLVQKVSSTGTGQTSGSVALTLSPGALSATGSGTTTGSAALTSTLALSASGTGQTTGSLNVTIGAVTHALSSTGTGTSTGSLAVSLTQAVSATGTGTSTGTLDVTVIGGSVTHAISATGTGTTSGSAALIGTLSLSSSGSGTSTGSVSVALVQRISATGTGTSTGSVAVTLVTGVVLDLSATGTGTTAGAAAITVSLGLSSTGLGQSGGSLTLRLGQALRSTGSGQSAGSLALVLRMPLGATGYGVSRGSAVLSYPTFRFTPPTHEEPIRPGKDMPRSIGYYRLTYAASIVLVGGRFQSIRTPNPDLLVGLVEGTDYFIGGHEYEVTRNVMAQLEADGFSSVPSFGYGMGAYGAGPYGD